MAVSLPHFISAPPVCRRHVLQDVPSNPAGLEKVESKDGGHSCGSGGCERSDGLVHHHGPPTWSGRCHGMGQARGSDRTDTIRWILDAMPFDAMAFEYSSKKCESFEHVVCNMRTASWVREKKKNHCCAMSKGRGPKGCSHVVMSFLNKLRDIDSATYKDESDIFYEDPVAFMNERALAQKNPPEESHFSMFEDLLRSWPKMPTWLNNHGYREVSGRCIHRKQKRPRNLPPPPHTHTFSFTNI